MGTAAKQPRRILLGQLAARGDCLYATAVARQIKADYPGCHLTWAIGSTCRDILDGNPHVDAVWEIPLVDHSEVPSAWYKFYAEAQARLHAGDFDEAFFTQIYPANFRNFDGTVRASIFRGYPHPITVPVAPILHLREDEIENVRQFATRHDLTGQSPAILFEFSSASDQSFVGPEFATRAAIGILAQLPNCRIVMTSQFTVKSQDPRIISGHTLSFRENAELTKYCTFLIGCSSGITWLCTSDWAKRLPAIQLLRKNTGVYASVVHDHERFGLPAEAVIEMTECPPEDLVDCVVTAIEDGVDEAKKLYHQTITLHSGFHRPVLNRLVKSGAYRDALASCAVTLRRYGPHPVVIALIAHVLLKIASNGARKLATRLFNIR
jgi:hypothetical protein